MEATLSKISLRKQNIEDIMKQINDQQKQIERLNYKINIIQNQNTTFQNLIQIRQEELKSILQEKQYLFIRCQELERGQVKPQPKVEESLPIQVQIPTVQNNVTAAVMTYFQSQAQQKKDPVILDDIDITSELEKLGLSNFIKKQQ